MDFLRLYDMNWTDCKSVSVAKEKPWGVERDGLEESVRGTTLADTSCHRKMTTTLSCVLNGVSLSSQMRLKNVMKKQWAAPLSSIWTLE